MTLTLRTIAAADWHALSRTFRDLTFEQTRAYSEPAAARIGATTRFVAVQRGGDVLALAALRVRSLPGLWRCIIWCPAGPMVQPSAAPDPDPDTIAAILTALRQQLVTTEGHILRLRFPGIAFHDETITATAARAGFQPTTRAPLYKSYAVDLRQSQDDLMRHLNGKWRGNLRNALKSGLTVDRSTGNDLTARFEAVFDAVQETKGFRPGISAQFHRDCAAEDYRPETFVICKDGVDLAAGMLVVTGQNANYLFGATNAAGRLLRAGYQLSWSMMLRGAELGVVWFDLGGVDFDANPDVAGYKERIGGPFIQGAGPFEAAPPGIFPKLVNRLEDLRARLRPKS